MQPVERIARIGNTAGGIGADAIILHIVSGQRGTPQQNWNFQPLARHFFQVLPHHHGGFHQQAGHADGVGAMFVYRGDHVGQLHLDAEIDHAVAVVGQDDIDQVLADIMHVALYRGQHDGAFLLAFRPFHMRFQMRHRGLHGLGTL